LVKLSRHHFFYFVLIILFPTIISSIYTERILPSVKSIGIFSTEILSIFPYQFSSSGLLKTL
jgi:hypothetical protein